MATPPGWEPAAEPPKAPPGWEPTLPLPTAINNPVTRSIATTGQNLYKMLVPQTVPGTIGQAASLIPIPGPLGSIARPALAATAAGVVDKLRGKEAGPAALEAGSITGLGEVVGGLARAGTRYALSKWDRMGPQLGNWIGKVVPAFKGPTPRQTINNAMGTEGQGNLGKQYGEAVDSAIEAAGNPVFGGGMDQRFMSPMVAERLQQAGKMPLESPVPGYQGPATKVWNLIKSEKRRLFNTAGEPTHTKGVFENIHQVYEAEEAFAKAIEDAIKSPGAKGLFARANAEYRKGKEIQELFTGGVGRMTPEKLAGIIQPGQKLRVDQDQLARDLQLRAGKLKETFGPEYAELERIIQRGSELGMRDVPGKFPVRLHLGFLPTVYGLPRATRRVGTPETQSAVAAYLARVLGARGAGNLIESPEQPKP